MTYSSILYEVEDGVAVVTLNNPAKRNAVSPAMEREFRQALEAASDDPAVRAIVVTGAGHSFCVGGDVESMGETNKGNAAITPQPPRSDALDENYVRGLTWMLRIAKPIVAAINGAAAGYGFNITLFCDLRYMVDKAKMTTAYARRGLVAETGSQWMLPRLIGPMNALDLLLTARTVTGAEAAELGLVRALPAEGFLEAVVEKAREIAKWSSPRSTAVIRRQVYDSLHQSLAQSHYLGEIEEAASFTSEDAAEGIAHFLEGREPRFTGR